MSANHQIGILRWVGLVASALLLDWSSAVAQTPDECTDTLILPCGYEYDYDDGNAIPPADGDAEFCTRFGIHDGPGCSCDHLGSRCWGTGQDATGYGSGYPLAVDLTAPPAQFDFPPVHLDPALSSSPLVSGEARHFRGPTAKRERPTHAGVFDLISGEPLLQAIDFELPFGGATFRHVRTYSEYYWRGAASQFFALYPSTWDWNGRGWMMGENPLLLIDARYPGVVPDGQKYCYFIPDAHHAVPFIYDANLDPPAYVAPPWFDAYMTLDGGQVDPENPNEWADRPTAFHVWIHNKSVRYTFEPNWDLLRPPELPAENCAEAHGAPSAGGWGWSHLGILTQLSDRYGNHVDFTYCGSEAAAWESCDNLWTADCQECCQKCNAIGQLQTAKLVSAGGTVAWTIVYTYREFMRDQDPANPDDPFFLDRMLHSIHVYEGDAYAGNPSAAAQCRTIPAQTFCDSATLDDMDAIAEPAPLPNSDWRIQVRYLYSESDYGIVQDDPVHDPNPAYRCANQDEDIEDDQGDFDGAATQLLFGPSQYTFPNSHGHLLKVAVTRRTTGPSAEMIAHRQYTLYRWLFRPWGGTLYGAINSYSPLHAVFESSTISDLLKANDLTVDELLGMPDDQVINTGDEATGTAGTAKLIELADQTWHPREGQVDAETHRSFANLEYLTPIEYRQFTDRRDGQKQGLYRCYAYYSTPVQWPYSSSWWRSLRYPYQSLCEGTGPDCAPWFTPSGTQTVFVGVVDAYETKKDESGQPVQVLRSRRIVEMNATGAIMRDRTWNGEGGLLSQIGFSETNIYDCRGRIIEKRTRGWDSQNVPEPDPDATAANGLIYAYEYEPDQPSPTCCATGDVGCECCPEGCSNPPDCTRIGELKAVGIKKGTDGDVRYISRIGRHADRPELITEEVQFPTPQADVNATPDDAQVTSFEYEFGGQTSDPIDERPIRRKVVSRSGVQPSAEDPELHESFAEERYDSEGNLEWVVFGRRTESTVVEQYVSHTNYDDHGRPVCEVFDLGEGWNPPSTLCSISGENNPERLVPNPTENPPLNYTSWHEYDSVFGRIHTVFPNLREQWIRYRFGDTLNDLEQWVFNDLEVDGTGYQARSPAQATLTESGKVRWTKQIEVAEVGNPPEPIENPSPSIIISTSTPLYDAQGQMVGMQREGENAQPLSAAISYDVFGQIARQREPDNTITRHVYDELGRLSHTYRGTKDQHEVWGNAPPDPNQNPQDPCDQEFINDDNLVLVEKRYYGSGVTNAGELVAIKNFRDKPINQYSETYGQGNENCWDDPCDPNDPGNLPPIPDNNEDNPDSGWLTQIEYDWRMRPVLTRRRGVGQWTQATCEPGQGSDGAALTHTLTWLDNLDRVRFTADFGAELPALAWDPRYLGPDAGDPTAAQILADSGGAILSLTENIYNLRGLAEEVRRYNVAVTDGSEYNSTLSFYDHADRPVEVHSPGAPIQRYTYDAKGRQILSKTVAAGVEVTRTQTEYDTNDRAIQSTHYERRHDATGTDFSASDYIATYRHTWYDVAGRVIATADYGTNHSSQYVNGSEPTYTTSPPTCSPTGPLVTTYDYDEAGRQTAVHHPDCTSVTRYEYDGLGRMLLMIENADVSEPNDRRVTAYKFDDKGRLEKIAAVLPTHNGGVTSYSQIQWEATNATLQVTQLIYGADVIPSSGGAAISQHNGWVAEVHYPIAQSGQPSEDDILQFSYYSDGLVATRTDALGRTFVHSYDALGRRIETRVEPPEVICPDPPEGECYFMGGIRRIAYEYEPDGLLARVAAYARDEQDQEFVAAENLFEYDDRRHLIADWQAHYDFVGAATPVVDYSWEFSPLLVPGEPPTYGYNFDRLVSLTYPERPQDATRRTVTLNYGNNEDDLDSALSRVTTIYDSGAQTDVGGYKYMGTGRRVSTTFGNGVAQTFAGGGGYTGLDRYGRIIDLNFTKNNGTQYRYQYGYDAMGNREYARITQRSTNGVLHLNDRSHRYEYDALQRLDLAETGKLTTDNSGLQSGTLILGIDWTLDNLGNWSGDTTGNPPASVTRTGEFDQNPGEDTFTLHHTVDSANRLSEITSVLNGGTPTAEAVQTDRNGNVVRDGNYIYRYDAWNRLLEVYEPGTAVLDDYGVVTDGALGDLVAKYSYDGVGRMIRIERTQDSEPVTIDLYYDGVRRIQEVLTTGEGLGQQMMAGGGESEPTTAVVGLTPGPEDYGTPAVGGELVLLEGTPPPPNPPDDGEFDPEAEDAAIRLDASSTAVSEPPSLEGGEFGGGSQQMSGGGGPTIVAEREYIWGPDYVDECVVQFDQNNVAYYVLQDANNNVVALLKADGLPAVQYTYEPYGALQLAESFTQHPVNRLGHQGLFFERFDAGPYDPALVPGARGLVYARNRWYDPVTGRWTTRDPNETALPVLTRTAWNGQPLEIVPGEFNAQGHYGDGMNLYAYLGTNPANSFDPLGLSEFDLLVIRDWDNIWESIVGNGSAYLGVQGAATWGAAWGGNVTVLPQMSGHLMGVSQGMSDFADYYADQVIWLPVNAGVQGFGAFNSAARVSASQSRRFGAFAAVGTVGKLADQGYDSFSALKRALGSPGTGKVWHHVVEQSKTWKFGVRKIQNVKNVVAVKHSVNQRVADLYSMIRRDITGSPTMRVREWLASKSFEFNREFGLKALKNVQQGIWP